MQHPFSFTRLRCCTADMVEISVTNWLFPWWDATDNCFTATILPSDNVPCEFVKISDTKSEGPFGNPTQDIFLTFQTHLHTFQHNFSPTRILKTPKIPYSNLVTKRALKFRVFFGSKMGMLLCSLNIALFLYSFKQLQ